MSFSIRNYKLIINDELKKKVALLMSVPLVANDKDDHLPADDDDIHVMLPIIMHRIELQLYASAKLHLIQLLQINSKSKCNSIQTKCVYGLSVISFLPHGL